MKMQKANTVLLLFCVACMGIEGCKVFEQKSPQGISQRRRQTTGWSHEWVTYFHYPTLYSYSICNNESLEIGQPLAVNRTGDLKYIAFENSTIPSVPVGVFISLGNVTELYLNNSGVEYIHPGAFSGLIQLVELYLQDNRIELLERGTVNHLSQLKILDLSRNRLKKIEKNSFLGLLMLNNLYLDTNTLSLFEFHHFESLSSLEILNLANNSLSVINENSFENLWNLHVLILSENKLTELVTATLKNSSLVYLDASQNYIKNVDFSNISENILFLNLSYNRVKNVENWSKVQKVIKIDISNNELEGIGKLGRTVQYLYLRNNKLVHLNSTFDGLSVLLVLDLSHNYISTIIIDMFKGLTGLQSLHLNNNEIRIFPTGCFKSLNSLKVLDLSSNLLSKLEYGMFNGLNNLEELLIAGNRITKLPENSFYILTSLRYLDVSGNSIKKLGVDELLGHLKHLQTISLVGNEWDCNLLFNTVKILKRRNVVVTSDNAPGETSNVYGIKCSNEEEMINIKSEDKNITSTANDIINPTRCRNGKHFEIVEASPRNTSWENLAQNNKELLQSIQTNLVKITSILSIILMFLLTLVLVLIYILLRFNKSNYLKGQTDRKMTDFELS